MEEIEARKIMEAYNKKYSPGKTLEEVQTFLETHAFFNMSPELAAAIMHSDTLK